MSRSFTLEAFRGAQRRLVTLGHAVCVPDGSELKCLGLFRQKIVSLLRVFSSSKGGFFPQLAPKYAWFAKMIDEKDIKAIEMMGRTCLVRLFFDI